MSLITIFLPQYRELNTLFTNVINSGKMSYAEQQTITEFWNKYSDAKLLDALILNIVINQDKHLCTLLLSRIESEVLNNIRLYESSEDFLTNIDTLHICILEVRRCQPTIDYQRKIVLEHSKEVEEIKEKLKSIEFKAHNQWKEVELRKQLKIAEKYHDKENTILNQLDTEKKEYRKEVSKYTINLFEEIHSLSLAFLEIVNSYTMPKPSATEEIIEEVKNEVNLPTTLPIEKVNLPTTLPIEDDMIFMTNGLKNLLSLEKMLINDKYLSEDLHWIATHKNKTADKKKLVTFLTGLVEEKYFLPNRDPKIKEFFESRYHISIGQNFEKKRRTPLVSEYKVVFHDYPFQIV